MSKSKGDAAASRTSGHREERPLIPLKYQHLAAIGFLVASLVLFFREPIFSGKVFLAADNLASHSFDTFLAEAKEEGVFPLWNPYIFCGMPSYGSLMVTGERVFDLSAMILKWFTALGGLLLLNPSAGWVIFYYMLFAVGMYFLAWKKLGTKVAAVAVALAATYSVFIIAWIMIGHNTKIAVLAVFPYIVLVIDRLRARFSLLWGFVLVLLLHFLFLPGHLQIIFYILLAIGMYLLCLLLRNLIKKEEWKTVLRTGIVFAIAAAMAFGMDADRYFSTLEYNPYSIRGANPIIESASEAAAKTTEGGLSYDYATNWSLGVGEIFTFLVPSLYGFGNLTYQGILTSGQSVRINTYFGPQPHTDAAHYMGVVVLVLAVIGFIRNRRDPFVQYLGVMIVFSLLVAFGKEFPLVYDLMYNYFPAFNKFRVPSMIIVLVQFMVPLLAGYGIASFLSDRGTALSRLSTRRWTYTLGGLSAALALAFVAPGLVESMYETFFPASQTSAFFGQRYGNPQIGSELQKFVVSTVITDVRFGLLFLLTAFAGLFLYIRGSIRLPLVAALVVGAIIADLWRVNTRPMETHEPRVQVTHFAAPDYVRFLQQDSTVYRTLQFENGQPPFSNLLAYWKIQSAYGYHGAKMRSYQDMLDVVGIGNPLLWQLMNVKYIITDRPDSSDMLGLVYAGSDARVYVNNTALPRAFFVNRYDVSDGLGILRRIADRAFDPRDVLYFTEDPLLTVEPPALGAAASVVRYSIQSLTLEAVATGNNLLFLSEAWYPMGWKAFLDGREIPLYRANYHFRAVVVPPGRHTVEMRFEPSGFTTGRTLSLGMNILVLGSLAFLGVREWRRRTATPASQTL